MDLFIRGQISKPVTMTGNGIINLTRQILTDRTPNVTWEGSINNTLGITGGNWNGQGIVTGLVTSSSGTFTHTRRSTFTPNRSRSSFADTK